MEVGGNVAADVASSASSETEGHLTDLEQRELKEAVLQQLGRTISDPDDAKVLADFVSELVEDRRTCAEMAAELSVLEDQATNFAQWVEEHRRSIIAKRSRSTGSAIRDVIDVRQGEPIGKSFVVVTDKLVLQPNPRMDSSQARGVVRGVRVGGEAIGAQANAASEWKKALLAKMTKHLREILVRLSDPGLDDQSRERYQSMAQNIQNHMAKLQPAGAKGLRP